MATWAFFAATVLVAGAALAEDQAKLIETLQSNAGKGDKAIACKRLAIYGNQEAAPALAALLSDAELSSWARIALEAIPGPAVDAALRDAAGKLQGRLLLGVIQSLGVRRDANAVGLLTGRLNDADVEVASASAIALGHIGGEAAAKAVEPLLGAKDAGVRVAAAEGCELCAERCLAEGKNAEAVRLYEAVRKADVPLNVKLQAVQGLVQNQGTAGLPLLAEQLASADKNCFAMGLRIAHKLAGRETTDLLVSQLSKANPQRQELLILALADRGDVAALPAILAAAKGGEASTRCAAIRSLLRLGNATCVSGLLDAALDANAEVAQTALSTLAELPGEEVNQELAKRLSAQPAEKLRLVLIQLAGRRAIVAMVPALLQATDDANAEIRTAALVALGTTVEFKDLPLLVERVAKPKTASADEAAVKSLYAACQRMPDREACAEKLVAAMAQGTTAGKCQLLGVLRSLGGEKALQAVGAAAKDADPQIKETASRLLGDWMDVAAAPTLLDLAKSSTDEKYKVRALRGYIRLARQFNMPDADRVAMCRAAMENAQRTAERKLVLEVMGRYPSPEMLKLAFEAAKGSELKSEAIAVAVLIANKTAAKSDEVDALLKASGYAVVKIEIVKAEYGAEAKVKDVTTILRKHVYNFPVIILPSPSYNSTFGGDPAPGMPKQLKVEYRMDGKAGSATFKENTTIELPKP